MLDAMGVNVHHDAVTGTAKQFVADDYAYMLFNAIRGNNVLYSQIIGENAKKVANINAE